MWPEMEDKPLLKEVSLNPVPQFLFNSVQSKLNETEQKQNQSCHFRKW